MVTEGDSDAQAVHTLCGTTLLSVFNRATRRSNAYSRHSSKGWLLDPRTGEVLSPAAVLIQEHKIVEVGPDPLADIGELERVRFVMKDGQVVRNDLALH